MMSTFQYNTSAKQQKNPNVSASICSVSYSKTKTIPKKTKNKTFSKFSSIFHPFVLSERLKRTGSDKEFHWERWKTLHSLLKYFHLSSSKGKTNNAKKPTKKLQPGGSCAWLFAMQQVHGYLQIYSRIIKAFGAHSERSENPLYEVRT